MFLYKLLAKNFGINNAITIIADSHANKYTKTVIRESNFIELALKYYEIYLK
jgi:hypothetical protein